MRALPTLLLFFGLLLSVSAEQHVDYAGLVTYDECYITVPLPHKPVQVYIPTGVTLTPKSRYQYSLWLPDTENLVAVPELELICDGARILYDGRICTVHKARMYRGDISIVWGDPGPGYGTQIERAPNSGHRFGGGVVPSEPPQTCRGYICPLCEKL